MGEFSFGNGQSRSSSLKARCTFTSVRWDSFCSESKENGNGNFSSSDEHGEVVSPLLFAVDGRRAPSANETKDSIGDPVSVCLSTFVTEIGRFYWINFDIHMKLIAVVNVVSRSFEDPSREIASTSKETHGAKAVR